MVRALLCSMLVMGGCVAPEAATPVTTGRADALAITPGMTLADWRAEMRRFEDGEPGGLHVVRTQFRLVRSGVEYVCASAPVLADPSYQYPVYHVFRDDRLWKIVAYPRPRIRVVEVDGRPHGQLIVEPWKQVDHVLAAVPLPLAAARDRAAVAARESARAAERARENSNLPPLAVFLGRLTQESEATRRARRETHRRLARQYDPLRIPLGVPREAVDEIMGDGPRVRLDPEGRLIARYEPASDAVHGRFGVDAVFENGRVVAVFGGQFVPREWPEKPPSPAESGPGRLRMGRPARIVALLARSR